jgi:hypothetical protein
VATIASAQTLAQMFGKMCWGGWPVSAFGCTRTTLTHLEELTLRHPAKAKVRTPSDDEFI